MPLCCNAARGLATGVTARVSQTWIGLSFAFLTRCFEHAPLGYLLAGDVELKCVVCDVDSVTVQTANKDSHYGMWRKAAEAGDTTAMTNLKTVI